MSNIYLKVTIEKRWCIKNFDFLSLKRAPVGQFLGNSNSLRYCWLLKLLVETEKSEIWKRNCVWLFYYFYFERNYDVLKSKSPCFLLNKNISFNKNETELQRVKLWWVGALEGRKSALFVTFILSKGNFFNICVLFSCIVYWINF